MKNFDKFLKHLLVSNFPFFTLAAHNLHCFFIFGKILLNFGILQMNFDTHLRTTGHLQDTQTGSNSILHRAI